MSKESQSYKTVKCPYCGAEYKVPPTVTYATCPYCGTTFKVDNPEEEIEHYLYKLNIDKNTAYRLARDFATQQIGVVEDLAQAASFKEAKLYYMPVYIYEINVKAPCREELEELKKEEEEAEEKREIRISIHGGEEIDYITKPATSVLPIPLPMDYGFPARARIYFKPTILKNGTYLQPLFDPMQLFRQVKQPYIAKASEEARISCSNGYELIDESKYRGIAHYPFWLVKYTYQGKEYTALVDAADGTIVYLEYPLSMRGRLVGFAGGTGTLVASSIIGGLVSNALMESLTPGLVGGALAALPAFAYTAYRLARFKGVYKFKPGEEAVFLPVR